jgi:hypothetical protein
MVMAVVMMVVVVVVLVMLLLLIHLPLWRQLDCRCRSQLAWLNRVVLRAAQRSDGPWPRRCH